MAAAARCPGYIEPGRNVHLDGYHALWFARSRHDSSDYARIARQKCVMSAMLNQLDPVTVLTNFNKIASAGKQIVGTNVPASVINQLLDLAVKARKKPISSVALVPPLIYPGQPERRQDARPGAEEDRQLGGHRPTGRRRLEREADGQARRPDADQAASPVPSQRQSQREEGQEAEGRGDAQARSGHRGPRSVCAAR